MNDTKYGVDCLSLEQLFSVTSSRYTIPTFQRTYSWSPREIVQLLDDIFCAEDLNAPYFIGSIVLAKKAAEKGARVADEIVLDGQQRLTTISLIIYSLLKRATDSALPNSEGMSEFYGYLFTRRLPNERGTKLVLQKGDREVYEQILHGKGCDGHASVLIKALCEIDKFIDEMSQRPPFSKNSNPFIEMLNRVLYNVEIVKITAPSEKEAFRLFETLNDRGLDLSAADLIKNKILSKCPEKDMQDAVASWGSIIEQVNDDVVGFLRAYWIAFEGFVRIDDLYEVFSKKIDDLNSSLIPSLVSELEECAKIYSLIVDPESIAQADAIVKSKRWLLRLNSLRAKSCRPVLIVCAKKFPSHLEAIAQLCATFTVRYLVVCEKNPNKLERLYSSIAEKLRTSANFPSLHDVDFSEIPNDGEIKNRLSSMKIASVNSSWREILAAINEAVSGDGELNIKPPKLANIEHILPQNPSSEALAEAGLSKEGAEELCSLLGNMTFLNSKRNKQISNKSFSIKKNELQKSTVKITSEIPGRWGCWNEGAIRERTNYLADEIVKIFKLP